MKIFIPKEDSNELRTAISPEIVKKLSGVGHEVFVETTAGSGSNFDDEIFIEAGAKIYTDNAQLNTADFIFRVNAPSENEIVFYKENSILIASLNPYNNSEIIIVQTFDDKTSMTSKADKFISQQDLGNHVTYNSINR